MFSKQEKDAPTCNTPMPSDALLPEVPKDSKWEFTVHNGSIETYVGSRIDRDHSEYQVMKIIGYKWIQTSTRCDWTPAVIIEPVGGINRFSVQSWRKVEDAVESSSEAV